jgi:hypothetical protein
MTLDASGNLGVGTTSPGAKLDVSNTLRLTGTDTSIVQNQIVGEVEFYSVDSDGPHVAGFIRAIGDETFGRKDALTFGVSQTNNTDAVEAMRINSSGNLLVGTTSTSLENSRSFAWVGSSGGLFRVNHSTANGSGDGYLVFGYNGSQIGSITQSGTTAVLYNITSDQRLKENIQDAAPASALIDALQVRQYDWKADGNHQRYGFIAQELVTVVPEAVHQPADPEEMMAVDYSKLVPMLVKEIQSLRARLAAANI